MPKRKITPVTQEPLERAKRTRSTVASASVPKSSPLKALSRKPRATEAIQPTTAVARLKQSPPKKATIEKAIRKALPTGKLTLDTSSSGHLFVHGTNDAGQLSLEDPMAARRYPFRIPADKFGDEKIAKVVCGELHSLAVSETGKVFSWGCNDEGALGTGKDDEENYEPKEVKGIDGKIVSVSAGDSHTAFLTEDGKIYLTGTMRDSSGAFGSRSDSKETCEYVPFLYHDPRRTDLRNDRAVKISSGQNHLAYLSGGGDVYAIGDHHNGQLGYVPSYRDDGGRMGKSYFLNKRRVCKFSGRRMLKFADVWCTPYATFVKSATEDRWFASGNNGRNQLGFPQKESEDGKKLDIETGWEEIEGFRDKSIVKIVGTAIQTIALSSDGKLYVCGDKEYLGLADTAQTGPTDTPVAHPFANKVRDVSCSSNNAVICITDTGDVFVWGSPASSVLGLPKDDDDAVAVQQAKRIQDDGGEQQKRKPFEDFKMLQVAAGAFHVLMIGQSKEAASSVV
ncbi:regulator of chromosome condensation-like isoform X2 [Paramacrobiotus metropolitanus]|nr:regulator of chromosome condensation-like isoform X2 [Paramacrobiotus metropolitanus]